MSLRRMFEGVECPRFGASPCESALVTIKSEPVTNNSPAVTNKSAPAKKRGRPASQSIEDRKAKAAAKVAEWRRQKAAAAKG